MIISAKYVGTCKGCNGSIAIGEKVEWTKGIPGARHAHCADAPVGTASAPARTSRRSRGARYCDGWGADNPHAPRPNGTCMECED